MGEVEEEGVASGDLDSYISLPVKTVPIDEGVVGVATSIAVAIAL